METDEADRVVTGDKHCAKRAWLYSGDGRKMRPVTGRVCPDSGVHDRYDEEGLDGLLDKRLTQVSHRRAPVDEVLRLVDRYQRRHDGWNVKHYYAWYRRDGGQRSYSWVKNALQAAGVVKKAAKRGVHRKRRDPAPWPGMLLHQDGSTTSGCRAGNGI